MRERRQNDQRRDQVLRAAEADLIGKQGLGCSRDHQAAAGSQGPTRPTRADGAGDCGILMKAPKRIIWRTRSRGVRLRSAFEGGAHIRLAVSL